MTTATLHPWLDSSQAVAAARRAATSAANRMPKGAEAAGDELFAEALIILTECALPPRDRGHFKCAECGGALENVRPGAKYCSAKCRNRAGVRRHRDEAKPAPPPMPPKGHIGSMWSWPEDQMTAYAVREVSLRLCHFLVTRTGKSEIPGSNWLDSREEGGKVYQPTCLPHENWVGTQTITLEQFRERQIAKSA